MHEEYPPYAHPSSLGDLLAHMRKRYSAALKAVKEERTRDDYGNRIVCTNLAKVKKQCLLLVQIQSKLTVLFPRLSLDMAQDTNSEFERIFGKTQRGNETKPAAGNSSSESKPKGPSDSDLLGIRTDSDRFIMKNLPESVLENAGAVSSASPQQSPQPEDKSHHDAMTIALNVNVFANIADAKREAELDSSASAKQHGKLSELLGSKAGHTHSADGPTFVIPLSKDPAKDGDAANAAPGSSARFPVTEESARVANIPAPPGPNAEFTRILHVEDKVKLEKPNFTASVDDSFAPTISSDPKLPEKSSEPKVITPPGPSDFTKVVKGSELRMLQEKLAAANQAAAKPPGWQPAPVPAASVGNSTPWQSAAPSVPQYVPASGTSWPGSGPSPAMPPPAAAPQPSRLSQYMPIIIALNLLVLIAILLIVFFAIKK